MICKLLLVFALATLSFAQELIVSGGPGAEIKLAASDLAGMPRTMIVVREHNVERKFEGVLLRDILTKAGAPLGPKLKGANMAGYVYFTAKDGYRVVLALAEIDTAFQENQIIVADTEDGKPLSAEQGPFRLIVPEDHKPARWIRMLQRIEVMIPSASASLHLFDPRFQSPLAPMPDSPYEAPIVPLTAK